MTGTYAGKVVLVTGAGRGMGRAIADAFANEGARLVISARTKKYGEEAVAAIRERGGEAVLAHGDVANRAAITEMMDIAIASFGQLDVVVHCAADNAHKPVVEMPDDEFDYLVHANIHSLFWIAKDAAEHLSKAADKGRIVYISSSSANRTFIPGMICYASTKAFMNSFARGLAAELGSQNILVNVVEPGIVASARMKEELSDDVATAITCNFPVPRPGTSEEIADSVLFLASNKANYITGATLTVDGGATMAQMPDLEGALSK